jgi:hypothetical protein
MSDKQNPLGALSLLAGWTVVSSIGWAAGLAVGMWLTRVATKLPWLNEDRFFVYATLISLGLTTGAAQWIVMRRYLPRPVRWVTATLIGYLLCLIMIVGGNLARLSAEGVWDDVLLLVLLGTAIGTSQWWVLRQHYRKAGGWVLATAAGFLCFLWTIIHPSHSLDELVIRGAIIGALAAAAPGATFVWLVRQPLATVSQRTV